MNGPRIIKTYVPPHHRVRLDDLETDFKIKAMFVASLALNVVLALKLTSLRIFGN